MGKLSTTRDARSGREATPDAGTRLVSNRDVEARCHKKDRYGREVCAVYVNRRDVGLEQIRQGTAWHYKEYQYEQPTQERAVYRDEEEAAKAARRGLWKETKLVPPWEWRLGGPQTRTQ